MEKSILSPTERLLKFIGEQNVQPVPLSVISRNFTRIFRNSDFLYSHLLSMQKLGLIKIEQKMTGHKGTMISICDITTQQCFESDERRSWL